MAKKRATMEHDGYCLSFVPVIKEACERKSVDDLCTIINRIYTDGFEDGHNEKEVPSCNLIIKSLHDASAECSCGNWHFVSIGERSRADIQEEFNKHKEQYG